ncbi:MAG: hypothetical protein E7109_04140 [Bacteroidales bacterium]|jgi:hypothetical protein|nr:hypothetical protein [Bacteroidales bacterium]
MKKVLYLIAAALVTVVACNKNTPDPTPTPTPEPTPTPTVPDLTISTPAIVDVEAESSIYTVKFDAGKAWTATLSYPDGSESGAVLAKEKGDAAKGVELKVTFQGLPEEAIGRLIKLDIKAGSKTESILFFQGLVFFPDTDETPLLSTAGGKFELNILTNMEYTITTYDAPDKAFPWAPVTITEDQAAHKLALAFNVEANAGYDARQAYVKFTLPQVQEPVLDDEGTPTGETKDMVIRFYVDQEGHTTVDWLTQLPAEFNVENTDEPIHDATATVAMFDGKLLVCDATQIHTVDPATGAFNGTLNVGDLPVQSIANDDAGNLLLASLIPYGGVGSIYAVKANDAKLENAVRLIPWVNEAWSGSRGADKVAAKGDVFGNGVVTMMYGGVKEYEGLSYCLAWEIKNGAADVFDYNEWNKSTHRINNDAWLTTPELGDNLWLSNRAAFVPAGPAVADGFFYGGYDGLYNVNYYDGSAWHVAIEAVGDWAGGPQGMGTVTWNGKKILAIMQMGYTWDGWGMPSYLWIADVTNPLAPEVISKAVYDNEKDPIVTGYTESSCVDVLPVVDGNDLVVYFVDSSQGHIAKVRFPKL